MCKRFIAYCQHYTRTTDDPDTDEHNFSWGIGKFVATIYKDMPALMFSVNGRLHKGNIIIALNGADYYEVSLHNDKGTTLINGEVCFDELDGVIDEYIESGTDKEEYNQFCKQQLKKLVTL